MTKTISITFETQEEVNAFEAVLSESMKSGNLNVAGYVAHFRDKLIRSVQAANQAAIEKQKAEAEVAPEKGAPSPQPRYRKRLEAHKQDSKGKK